MKAIVAEWSDLLVRRPAFREALEPLGRVIDAWQSWSDAGRARLDCTAETARRVWSAGEPLLALGLPTLDRERVEALLQPALDVVSAVEDAGGFADAWDRGDIGPEALLPTAGSLGSIELQERSGLTQEALAFLAVSGLRPALGAWFEGCRDLVDGGGWDRGTCPCCGMFPGFADLLEDGRRRLACHVCDARWTCARLICPLCSTRATNDFVRLIAEDADEGYAIAACRACRGYVKELDRRARWNAGSAIVEDWGSPHLDLVAHRQHYWRPIPTIVQLAASTSGRHASPTRAWDASI